MEDRDRIQIVERISKAMCQILVAKNGQAVAKGTGVFVEGNLLYTAAHVLLSAGNEPHGDALAIRGQDYVTPLAAKYAGPIMMNIAMGVTGPIPVDLVVLQAINIPPAVIPLPLSAQFGQVGAECIIAGYPDDISFPLDALDHLFGVSPELQIEKERARELLSVHYGPTMYKRCMIGSRQAITFNDPHQDVKIDGALYWLDNDLTYGGSGGPMVNAAGELVGILVQKGTTDATRFKILGLKGEGIGIVNRLPSGIGLALSHQFLTEGLNQGVLRF